MIVDIPNGVDLEPFACQAARPRTLDPAIKPEGYVLFLGRLRRQKGVDVLLEALHQLPASGDAQLVVAGDGEFRPNLENLCHRLGLDKRVRFLGQVVGQDKVYLLQNALATIVPSRGWEAFGLVVLESHAAGRPVIASNLPGLADNVQPERTGFIVSPESPDELAQRLRQVFSEPQKMRQMGETGRRSVGKYAWEHVAARHLELYERLRVVRSKTHLAA
jgi:glycosyltransferase involved in cell wall biosynthesis